MESNKEISKISEINEILWNSIKRIEEYLKVFLSTEYLELFPGDYQVELRERLMKVVEDMNKIRIMDKIMYHKDQIKELEKRVINENFEKTENLREFIMPEMMEKEGKEGMRIKNE